MPHSCTQEIDRARGIPCPSCSDSLRAPDKLLLQDLALPPLAVDPFAAPAASSSAADDQQDSREDGTGVSSGLGCCGYLYYDPAVAAAAAAAGEAQQQPWTCDTCGLHLPDDTHELWGRCEHNACMRSSNNMHTTRPVLVIYQCQLDMI